MSETELSPHLSVAMRHQIGALRLDVAFQLTRPWSLLFAPSGAGKTTILRAIAGLIKPKEARIVARGALRLESGGTLTAEAVLVDTASGRFTPAHRRAIRMVSQEAALFPHLSVLANVRYGLFSMANTQQAEALQDVLALCRIEHLVTKMPSQLSGGERQRVALARSLAPPGCALLLLDEPFTGLDAKLRGELIVDLRVWLARRGVPVLSVTHDVAEAFHLDAEILRLREGRISQQGSAQDVLADERARLLGQLSGAFSMAGDQADSLRE